MIKTTFVFAPVEKPKPVPQPVYEAPKVEKPAVVQENTPSPEKAPVPQKDDLKVEKRRSGPSVAANGPSTGVYQSQKTAAPRTTISNSLMSPTRNIKSRKTVVTDSGSKKVVQMPADAQKVSSPRSPGSGKWAARKGMKQAKASDIFGDFFGFGPNPQGCMAKNAEPIDLKKEKARLLGLLGEEAKRYDVQGMHIDLNSKTE